LKNQTQFRLSYGAGFRAPQAFDADMHLAFAGGGVSRISLSPQLREERSRSWSASINHDHATEKWVAGFTLEGFFTRLNDAFFLDPIGTDAFGERFVKSNGDGSRVQGATLELRANYNKKLQLEAGFTLQSSLYDTPVEHIENLPPLRAFLRTPNDYGYATLGWFPNKKWTTTLNLVYTGRMQLAHFAGAPEQSFDVVIDGTGGPGWGARLAALRPGGVCAVAGAIAGPLVETDLRRVYLDDLTILGCTHQPPQVYARLVGLIDEGRVRPLISRTYPLREIATAQADFLTKRFPGKLVLIPPETYP
jgi:hypothetical protein